MFSDILKEERLKKIIKIFDRKEKTGSIESDVCAELDSIINELAIKNNEFAGELVRDKTLIRFCKIKKFRRRAQEGHIQLSDFQLWLLENIEGKILTAKYDYFSLSIVDVINYFEEYVIRLKERETALLEVFASWGSLILAIIAITISLVAMNISSF